MSCVSWSRRIIYCSYILVWYAHFSFICHIYLTTIQCLVYLMMRNISKKLEEFRLRHAAARDLPSMYNDTDADKQGQFTRLLPDHLVFPQSPPAASRNLRTNEVCFSSITRFTLSNCPSQELSVDSSVDFVFEPPEIHSTPRSSPRRDSGDAEDIQAHDCVVGRPRAVLFDGERYYLEPSPKRPKYFFNENGSLYEVSYKYSTPFYCPLTLAIRLMIVIQVWTTGLR